MVKLNLGAGSQVLDGWLSVDLEGEPDIRADVRMLPLPDDYADELQAIHVFEHLYRWDALDTLIEWRRVLKPGGRLAIELPDLLKCCSNILGGQPERSGLFGLFGDPKHGNKLMLHKWCYTRKELAHLMVEAGFKKPKLRPVQWHKKYRDMRLEAVK